MSAILDVLVCVVALVAMLTVLVVVHEGGHALVARLVGARVTEFFVGMPWGPQATRVSRRTGIRYGATFALLGGYTRIAGMEPGEDEGASRVLALANERGCLTPEEAAEVLDGDAERARAVLDMLVGWGSLVAVFRTHDEGGGSRKPHRGEEPLRYEVPRRDARGLTLLDRSHDFSNGSSPQGAPYDPGMAPEDFLAAERARTYAGLGFFRRLAVLVAGVAVNIALAFLVVAAFCCLHGVTGVTPWITSVQDGSPAQEADLQAGDEIVELGGVPARGADGLASAIVALGEGSGAVSLVYERDGTTFTTSVSGLGGGGKLGVTFGYTLVRLGPGEACAQAGSYVVRVGQAVASLLVPSQAGEVLEGSSGVVGIAAVAGQAVSRGFWQYLLLVGMLSASLGWMNLLPIPPLDGGKVLFELIRLVIRRDVPLWLQAALSWVGILLFALLFAWLLVHDVGGLAGLL